MTSPAVLIITDDPQFSRDVANRWQSERTVPAFTLIAGDSWMGAAADAHDLAHGLAQGLAMVGPLRHERVNPVLNSVARAAGAVLHVPSREASVQQLRAEHPRVTVLIPSEAWLDDLVLLGTEVLRRLHASDRCRQAEQAAQLSRREAVLGRYMLDNRHSVNNALTSVLGNAELLLDESSLPARVRDQIQTVQAMAIHLREVMQRFSSLAVEMQSSEKSSQHETRNSCEVASVGP